MDQGQAATIAQKFCIRAFEEWRKEGIFAFFTHLIMPNLPLGFCLWSQAQLSQGCYGLNARMAKKLELAVSLEFTSKGIVSVSQMWLRLRVELDCHENQDRYNYLFLSKMI